MTNCRPICASVLSVDLFSAGKRRRNDYRYQRQYLVSESRKTISHPTRLGIRTSMEYPLFGHRTIGLAHLAERAPERKKALLIFLIQLGFNLAWPFIFFGARLIGTALLEITVLLIVIIVNIIAFWRIKPLSGLLMLPYALWVAYATVLNVSIWILN